MALILLVLILAMLVMMWALREQGFPEFRVSHTIEGIRLMHVRGIRGYAPMVDWAKQHGIITTVHTGGSSIPGSSGCCGRSGGSTGEQPPSCGRPPTAT